MSLESKIESLLFWKGEPVALKEIYKFLDVEKREIERAIEILKETFVGRGITLVQNGDEVMLYTAPEAGELIQKLTKEEFSREVSKAGVEVLSLIVYRGPIAKREIDYIRGVNSSYIVRNLIVRGLIERIDSKDARSFVYQPTFELLAHLGISKKEELPDFEIVTKDIATFMATEKSEEIKPEERTEK